MRPWLLILFSFSACLALSQPGNNYIFHHLDQANGLLHNTVRSITQDADGYIWIGTNNGLQRYDGLRFVNYQGRLHNSNTDLINVQNIIADDRVLWFFADTETVKLERSKNRFSIYSPDQKTTDSLLQYSAYTDEQNQKWMVTQFGIYRYDAITKKLVLYFKEPPYDSKASSAHGRMSKTIVEDREQGKIWAVGNDQLFLFDVKTKKVYNSKYNPIHDPLLDLMKQRWVSRMMIDTDHNFWLASWNYLLYKYNPVTKKLTTFSLFDLQKAKPAQFNKNTVYINCIYEDVQATIWVGTEAMGLLKYNRHEDQFEYVSSPGENKESLQYNYNIYCIFQDQRENIWLGTDKGINIFNPYHTYFQSIHHEPNQKASLPKDEITSFMETANDDVLIGTWGGGITLYDKNLRFKKTILVKGSYESNLVWSFIQSDDQKIWVGCQHGYLHIYDPLSGKIQTLHPNETEGSTIRCMQKDRLGNIWFGLNNGKIAKWDKALNGFVSYNAPANTSFPYTPVYNIFMDAGGSFWIATDNGLKQFDPKQRRYSAVFVPDKENASSISSEKIRGIEQLDDSTLVIGTINGGLNFFNVRTKAFTHLTTDNGLPSNSICAIKRDAHHCLWITADYGLYKLNSERRVTLYNIDPAMINSAFTSNNFYALHDGRWLTSTSTDVISFHPDSLSKQSSPITKVTITGLKLFDHPLFIDSMEGDPIHLGYQQNFITIEFSALNYFAVQQSKFYYRLSGVDKSWVQATTNGVASYTNLPPGDYLFSVKASDDKNAPVTSLSIIISPPWYKTWWFILLSLAALAFLVYRWMKVREKNIKARALERAHTEAIIQHTQTQLAQQQHKMAEAEMNALRAQMNPHFLFNSLNSINNYILKNDADNAAGYLTKFSRLMRLILDNSRSNWVGLPNELKALQLYVELEAFRFDNSFTYRIDVDASVNTEHVMVPPMIIQPYVENAIWHGLMHKKNGGGHLEICIYKEEENLCITIKDNGVGRESAQRMRSRYADNRKSYGMKITAERLEIMNKAYDIKAKVLVTDIQEETETGTVVFISFKYSFRNELASLS